MSLHRERNKVSKSIQLFNAAADLAVMTYLVVISMAALEAMVRTPL